jgi:hypothetical protein
MIIASGKTKYLEEAVIPIKFITKSVLLDLKKRRHKTSTSKTR